MVPKDSKKIIIEIYDAYDQNTIQKDFDEDEMNITDRSDFEVDEDKILYTKIGKTEINIDKVLTNLLV